MKRNGLVVGVLLLVICTATAPASAQRFAVGAFGGYQWPIVQDDAEPGGLWGLKGKVAVTPMFDVEPNITRLYSGDATTESGTTITAPEVTNYALNGNMKLGGIFQLTAGLGWASLDIPSAGSSNNFAWNAGLAFTFPVGPLMLDLGGRFLLINHADDASRKHGYIQAGLNYWF